jgi:hypothetical protein
MPSFQNNRYSTLDINHNESSEIIGIDSLEKDPKNLSLEETFENLNILEQRMVNKLDNIGLGPSFEVLNRNKRRNRFISGSLKLGSFI